MKFQNFIIIIKEVQKTTSKINLSHKHKNEHRIMDDSSKL